MAQRNMLCTQEFFDLETEPGQTHHPEFPIFLGNTVDPTNPGIHQLSSASRSGSNVDLPPPQEGQDDNFFYGNQYGALQHHHYHLVPILNMARATPSTYNHPYLMPSPANMICTEPLLHGSLDHMSSSSSHGFMGASVDEHGRSNFLDIVRGPYKRKNAEVIPGCFHHIHASASSSSMGILPNSGPQQWDKQLEPAVGMLDSSVFGPEHNRGSRILSIAEGSNRIMRGRANAINLNLDPTLAFDHCHALQGSSMGRSFQPSCNAWMEQFRHNGGDATSSNWNFPPPMPYLPGRSINGGLLEIGSVSGQGYRDTASSSNSAVIMDPSSMHQHHSHHPLAMEGMQGVGYNSHPQLLGPSYRRPMNFNMQNNTMISGDGLESASMYPRAFTSSGDRIYRPRRRDSQSAHEEFNAHMRLLSSEDVAVLEFQGFYEVGNSVDQHRDMRLDIDDMSYEELLALEERIGDVKIGLSEETISKCLRTRTHVSCIAPSSLGQSSEMVDDNTKCTVCQVEYGEDEKVGILECGHEYHVDCIKQWLMLKNTCPICKKTALCMDDKE